MVVLSREDLKDRLQKGEILDSESVEGDIEDHVEGASVMLTVDRDRNIISNTIYADSIGNSSIDGDNFNLVNSHVSEHSYEFKVPSRELAILTTREKISMPSDLVGRVGIRLSASKHGLIPLFGPQVDPGYEGEFYAVVYNVSDQDLKLDNGKFDLNGTEGGVLKLEVEKLSSCDPKADSKDSKRQDDADRLLGYTEVDTRTPNLSNLRDDLGGQIDELEQELRQNEAAVTEVKKGYSQIVLFGVFLLATATFGTVLPQVINAASKVSLGENLQTVLLVVFSAAWLATTVAITAAVLLNIKRGME